MMATHRMEISHESDVGQARRYILDAAQRLGGDAAQAGEAAIVATELGTNLVKHGGGGEILVQEIKDAHHPGLEIHALDTGPGMANVNACMRDGYSTAGSAGNGLGAIQRLADMFQVQSQQGRGTAIWVRLAMQRTAARAAAPGTLFEAGGVSVALKGEDLCGDSWDVQETSSGLRAVVADGLGHGPFAEEASREAVTVFRRNVERGPAHTLELMHLALAKTRGAACSIAEISPRRGEMRTAGAGNVLMRFYGSKGMKTVASDNGTLGIGLRKTQEMTYPWENDGLLVMYSDGISSQWKLEDYPGLMRRHPSLIAGVIYRDFKRPHDDATVVVIRQPTSS